MNGVDAQSQDLDASDSDYEATIEDEPSPVVSPALDAGLDVVPAPKFEGGEEGNMTLMIQRRYLGTS